MRRRAAMLCLGCVLAVAFVGCDGATLDTEAVTGTVTLDGKPLAGAMVNFTPVSKEGGAAAAYGKTDENGRFKLQTMLGAADAGTTPGEYIVTVSKTELQETGNTITNSDGTTSPEMEPVETLPEKYTKTSESDLRATVVDGEKNDFTFELTSD